MTAPNLVYNVFTDNFDYTGLGGGGGVFTWTDVTTTSKTMVGDNGYTANNSSLITFTLPITCPFGQVLRIVGKGTGLWKIAQNSGQVIHYGNLDTTVGVTGYLASVAQYDAIEILCTVANTEFTVINGPQGNITTF